MSAMAGCAPTRVAQGRRRRPITSSTGSTGGAPRSRSSPACAATTTGPITAASSTSTSTPVDGLVRFTRPGGGVILGRAATAGTAAEVSSAFPVEAGTVPSRWDGSPLLATELSPPLKERAAPTGLRFGSPFRAERTAARIAKTLRCRFEQEGAVFVTSSPELITITPEPAGGSLVTIEVTTRPRHLSAALTTLGLTLLRSDTPTSPGGDDG